MRDEFWGHSCVEDAASRDYSGYAGSSFVEGYSDSVKGGGCVGEEAGACDGRRGSIGPDER